MINKNTLLFENILAKIDKKIPFMGMNPLNAISEKKRFLKNPDYTPIFRYAKPSVAPEKLFRKAEEIEMENNVVNNLLLQKLEKFKKTNAMLQSIGNDEFTFFSKEIFGVPDKELLDNAYKILENKACEEDKNIPSKKICDMVKRVLDVLGLGNWDVRTKNMTARAAVVASKKKVYIRKNSLFSLNFVKGMIVHEIGTHVFRASNGEKQPYDIFRTGLPNYLMTEEGLAVNAEEMNNCLKINTLRAYAGRVIAVHLSLKAGFRQVFEELRKYFDDNLAWRITLRAKRGLVDTSKPGAYTKDYLYLKGYYEVKKFLEENRDNGLKTLYYGKIGLEHVPLMKDIEDLKEPELVPNSKKFRKVVKEIGV